MGFISSGASGDMMIRGEYMDAVAVATQPFADVTAADFISTDFVWRVKVADDQDVHESRL